jgi:hypothetical protein
MAQRAISILSDEDKLLEFKRNAKKRALEFHINNIVPQYEKVYEQVTGFSSAN